MIRDVLGFAGETLTANIALVFFVALFAGVVIWTFRGGRNRFEHESRLPFDDAAPENLQDLKGNHP